MAEVLVLGAGLVGSVLAADLASDDALTVTVADRSVDALERAARRAGGRARTVREDLSDPARVRALAERADVVAGALASRLGFGALRAVIEAGRPCCDISFMAEDALELDDLARARQVTAVVDCGVAPGMSHMLAGHAVGRLDEPREVVIYVGGLPRERRWPFQYKAGFAPADVLEEYTRPARLVENGRVVVREALSECEPIDFDGLGTLEAFNTDGLRSLVRTLDVPYMKEKTLRYPGHAELMRVFHATGLFGRDPVDAGGTAVRPIDLLSALLFPRWAFEPGEADLTVMRVIVRGLSCGRETEYRWDLLDRYDPDTATSSMARTTAFPCAIVTRMLARGDLRKPGVIAPEILGASDGVLEKVLEELGRRGVEYRGGRRD